MKTTFFVFDILCSAFVFGKCEENVGKPLLLTPLLEANEIQEAQESAKVSPSIGNITSYSGYFTTNKTCGNNLFFWFCPALEEWESAPVAFWLQGGPGGHSLYGSFLENGPFIHSKEEGLQRRKYSWNNKRNIVYIDQPVGAGFSFSTKNCSLNNLSDVSEELYSAIIQFFQLFPILEDNYLFFVGQSFAGHYIPAIAQKILKTNSNEQYRLNLKGLMIGDAWVMPREQLRFGDLIYQLGLISPDDLQEFLDYEKQAISEIDAEKWLDALNTWSYSLDVYTYYTGADMYNYLPHPETDKSYQDFLQLTSTRRAIHVGSTDFNSFSQTVYNSLNLTIMTSAQPLVEEILPHVPILFYTGQLDVIVAHQTLVNGIRSLNWSGQHIYLESAHNLWIEGGEVAGYITGEYNLFDVLVRAAGHDAPTNQPFWVYQLFNNFTSGTGVFSGKLSTMSELV